MIMKKLVAAALALLVLSACADVSAPRASVGDVTIGGASYCVSLSALVGALGGGTVGALVPISQSSSDSSTVSWAAMSTALGAAAGAALGYALCGGAASEVPAAP